MIYERILPSNSLSGFIESFWLIDSETDSTPKKEKIIPDGFSELIFHYGDRYKVNISGAWESQAQTLLAGQIRNHFYLENTGRSGMIGIKFRPAALAKLFSLDMSAYTDKVVPLSSLVPGFSALETLPKPSLETKGEFIEAFENIIYSQLSGLNNKTIEVEIAIDLLQENHGSLPIADVCSKVGLSERQLERQFSKYIGLSPKFYARIIRLGYIFELMQNQDSSWSDLVYNSGFYDQSHFIKNFKEFTGEDPSTYGFTEKSMANFHLKK